MAHTSRQRRICMTFVSIVLLTGTLALVSGRQLHQHRLDASLIAAIHWDDTASVQTLLAQGASANAKEGATRPVTLWEGIMELFQPSRRKNPPYSLSALQLALQYPNDFGHQVNCEIVKMLLHYGANVQEKDRYGRTPLVALFSPIPPGQERPGDYISWEDTEAGLALIEAGADVNARDAYGFTALMKTCDLQVMQALVSRGAEVNARTPNGLTPLLCCNGKEGLAFLLDQGAAINAASHGWTVLHYAAQNGDQAVAGLLLSRGANVNANIGHGRTPLMAAASGGHHGILERLLSQEAKVNARDEYGFTALVWAARRDSAACVALLLKHGARVDVRSTEGKTLLHLVRETESRGQSVLGLLKRAGARE